MCILNVSVILFLAFSASASWIEFNAGTADSSEPVIRHGETTEDFILFDVELRGLDSRDILHESIEYSRFSETPGVRMYSEAGYPEVPVVTCFVAVPDNVVLSLESSRSCADHLENTVVYPAPSLELVTEGGSTFYREVFQKNATAYSSSNWFPSIGAEISGEFRLRDQRVAVVDVYPVQFLASEDSLRVWSDVQLNVSFSASAPVVSSSDLGPYERLIGNTLIGYDPDPQPYAVSPPSGSVYRPTDLTIAPPEIPDYVIIVAGGLDGSWVDDLANHRAQLNGFDVLIARGDDIFWQFRTIERVLDPDLIRDFTETLWSFGAPGDRPSYLLLIGDHEDGSCTTIGPWFLPTAEESSDGFGNDEWYAYFDEPRSVYSSMPDMIVGRLSTREATNLQDMIDLIEEYESPVTGTVPASLQYRRFITRLSGTGLDNWSPSPEWTEGLKDWMGYQWDNYHCGDGEDDPPNSDGSDMTSAEWVTACNMVFNRGSHVAFYTDHGDFHLFNAGLNEELEDFGVPDSCFDNLDVADLGTFTDHWPPFILMLCCSSGTFNHTQYQHDNRSPGTCLCHEPVNQTSPPPYDLGSECLAEEFIRNTSGGAIGVFASSNASSSKGLGSAALEGLYYESVSRAGDVIAAGRVKVLSSYWTGESFGFNLGRFNLFGDPAIDLGDRVKYRSMCDLIVSPDDLSMNQYPTRDPAGSYRRIELSAVARNAGAVASGPFDVDLTIVHEGSVFTLSERCNSGLAPGEEGVFDFIWVTPASFEDGDEVTITAAADEDKICSDSWWGNNSASVTLEILDVYPNEDNWPVNLPGSVKCPPMLMDINGDGKLEIIALSGVQVYAIDQISGQVLWESGYFSFTESDNLGGFTVPVFGDVAGDGLPEIVIDTRQELVILNSTDGTVLHTFDHGLQQGNLSRGPHGVTLADVFPESGKLEIAFVAPVNSGDPLSLFLLTVDRGQLIELDRETIPQSPFSYSREWISASNLTADQSDELVLSYSWYSSGYNSGVWIYDFDETTLQAGFTDSYTRPETENTAGIHAVGEIAGVAGQIAWSRQHTGASGQAWLLDSDDLSTHQICEQPSSPSDYIHCCVLADWDEQTPGLDRIIAPAENQCLAWNQVGDLMFGWNEYYESTDNRFPPLPALANLVAESGFQTSEVIVGTRDGWVNAYDTDRNSVFSLGFPYQLPSEVAGGFVAADIDLDGKLEVVFGTMDNYLHVWELGSCPVGYAPWPQSQHDAMRTGALEN